MSSEKIDLLGASKPVKAEPGLSSFETALVRAVNSYAAFYSQRLRRMNRIHTRTDLKTFMDHVAKIMRVNNAYLVIMDKAKFDANKNKLAMPNLRSRKGRLMVIKGEGTASDVMGNYDFVTFIAMDKKDFNKAIKAKEVPTAEVELNPQGVLLTDFNQHIQDIMMSSSDSGSVKLVYGTEDPEIAIAADDDDDDDDDEELTSPRAGAGAGAGDEEITN